MDWTHSYFYQFASLRMGDPELSTTQGMVNHLQLLSTWTLGIANEGISYHCWLPHIIYHGYPVQTMSQSSATKPHYQSRLTNHSWPMLTTLTAGYCHPPVPPAPFLGSSWGSSVMPSVGTAKLPCDSAVVEVLEMDLGRLCFPWAGCAGVGVCISIIIH